MIKTFVISVALTCVSMIANAQSVSIDAGIGGNGASIQIPGLSINSGAGGDGASIVIDGGAAAGTPPSDIRLEGNGSLTMGDGFDTEAFIKAMETSGGAVNLLIHFEFGSDRLTEKGKEQVEQVADALWDLEDDAVIVVEGHTDSVGSDADNLDLSNRRARTVMAALMIDHGVEQALEQSGKGESAPIASNETDEGRALNRRVTFIRK